MSVQIQILQTNSMEAVTDHQIQVELSLERCQVELAL